MNWRRTFLSVVLAGGCIWCVGRVQQVHSEEKPAAKPGATAYTPVAPAPMLAEAQEYQLAELKKAVSDGKPNFKHVEEHAHVLSELFNIRQYHKETDHKAAAAARDLSIELAKVSKAKDADQTKALAEKVIAAGKKPAGDKPAATEPPPAYKPVSPVHPLMEFQDHYFDEIKKMVNASDAKKDFKVVESSAYVLAELCNINSYQQDKEDYKKWAQEARELSLNLAKAAKDKDTDKAKGLYREIHVRCTACHDQYK